VGEKNTGRRFHICLQVYLSFFIWSNPRLHFCLVHVSTLAGANLRRDGGNFVAERAQFLLRGGERCLPKACNRKDCVVTAA